MSEPREVLADFLLQGHLTYRPPGLNGASDYQCADALIRDLAAEGVVVVSAAEPVAIVSAAHIAALEAERDAAYARGLEDAAKVAERCASQNAEAASIMHKRSAKQARVYDEDVADQTKISAQVLDSCAEEASNIAAAIRALKPGEAE